MTKQLQSQLTQATISTFENLGFVLPEPTVREEQAEAPLAWSARVEFRGPQTGWVDVSLTDDVLTEIATNMLGAIEVDDSIKRDALGEIANVICGNVVPALGRPQDIFDLDTPTPRDVAELPEAVERLAFGVSGGRVELGIFVDGGAA